MTWLTRIRVSPGIWLAPVMALISMTHFDVPATRGYALASATRDAYSLLLVAALSCAAGAWEGHRLQTGGVLSGVARRSRFAIMAAPWASAVVVPTALDIVIFIRDGAFTSIDAVPVIVTTIATAWVWALAGMAVGVAVRPALSVPLSLIVPVLWLIMLPASQTLWLRHLTGGWPSCCSVNSTLSWRAILATWTVLASMLAASLLVLWTRGRAMGPRPRIVAGLVAVLVAGGLVGGASMVRGMGPDPIAPRTHGLRCDMVAKAKVCVWPEHEAAAARFKPVVATVFPVWRQAGVTLPEVITEASLPDSASSGSRDDRIEYIYLGRSSPAPDDLLGSLTSDLATAPCLERENVETPAWATVAQGRYRAWLQLSGARALGLSEKDVRDGSIPTDQWHWAQEVFAQPAAQQTKAVNVVATRLSSCR
ncbi:hypothetical protein FYJ43_03890 [Cutibacterium sp. WCA-380-WT-3A]|uniref:DUF7224 domain-containing protein n=1 Tax=Cutibacterium porci TaxID=2605781 RepID=A0A7K0J5I9_9ACTN|nr:hypothetical protein [Cutibacterium porci]MSS45204.1 hypothetical protein [Cutibacterium porci]